MACHAPVAASFPIALLPKCGVSMTMHSHNMMTNEWFDTCSHHGHVNIRNRPDKFSLLHCPGWGLQPVERLPRELGRQAARCALLSTPFQPMLMSHGVSISLNSLFSGSLPGILPHPCAQAHRYAGIQSQSHVSPSPVLTEMFIFMYYLSSMMPYITMNYRQPSMY